MSSGNIILCGVGGQGILLASEITAYALLKTGYDVKKSEVHGMAQRGGSVVAHLRYGKKVYSPLIELGTVDIAVAFEMLESLRYLPYLKRESKVIVNTQKILPAPVATGVDQYPDDVLGELTKRKLAVFPLDAYEISRTAGEIKAVNMALVGALSSFLPIGPEAFLEVIREHVPEKFRDVNCAVFLKGRETIERMRGSMHEQTASGMAR